MAATTWQLPRRCRQSLNAKSNQYHSSGLQRQMKPTLVRALVALFTSGKVTAPYSSPLEGVATGTAALKCRHWHKIADIGNDEAPRGPMMCILAWLHLDTRNQAFSRHRHE